MPSVSISFCTSIAEVSHGCYCVSSTTCCVTGEKCSRKHSESSSAVMSEYSFSHILNSSNSIGLFIRTPGWPVHNLRLMVAVCPSLLKAACYWPNGQKPYNQSSVCHVIGGMC
ncbi:unnamed protein product [Macrosiphum euphorbiae]|uniref:Secreted protein n=1 Tax=Macrosiphum euphorbiae TaxID=13131 RepID=A0AAV0VKY3_9HEMI|nr:unnamed protein product [Macrosiphum euphorbiae]